jgi:hypothetical protein
VVLALNRASHDYRSNGSPVGPLQDAWEDKVEAKPSSVSTMPGGQSAGPGPVLAG